jgi:hypothetical protein
MSVAVIFSVNAEKELMKLPKLIAKRIAEKNYRIFQGQTTH